jgi:hypothetical protein
MAHLRQGSGGQGAYDCPREQEVVNAVLGGRWPDRCDESLVDHAAHCVTCREVAQVSVLLHEDVDHARIDVIVPAAGQIWWRAAVRARLESTQAAARPMTWMHAITSAIIVGVFLAGLTAVWPMVPGVLNMIRSVSSEMRPSPEITSALTSGLAMSAGIAAVAAMVLVITPLALYFVLSDD